MKIRGLAGPNAFGRDRLRERPKRGNFRKYRHPVAEAAVLVIVSGSRLLGRGVDRMMVVPGTGVFKRGRRNLGMRQQVQARQ